MLGIINGRQITKEEMGIRLDYLSGYSTSIFCELKGKLSREEKLDNIICCLTADNNAYHNIFFQSIKICNYKKNDDISLGYFCNQILLEQCLDKANDYEMSKQTIHLISRYANLNLKKLKNSEKLSKEDIKVLNMKKN